MTQWILLCNARVTLSAQRMGVMVAAVNNNYGAPENVPRGHLVMWTPRGRWCLAGGLLLSGRGFFPLPEVFIAALFTALQRASGVGRVAFVDFGASMNPSKNPLTEIGGGTPRGRGSIPVCVFCGDCVWGRYGLYACLA